MIDAYVSELPGSALGAIGGSLLAVGLSLVLGVAITIVALGVGALVQLALDRPRRRAGGVVVTLERVGASNRAA